MNCRLQLHLLFYITVVNMSICQLLYESGVSIVTILLDLDIALTTCTNIEEIMDGHNNDMISEHNARELVTIFDKLADCRIVNAILTSKIVPVPASIHRHPKVLRTATINHSLRNDTLQRSYTRTDAYNALYNNDMLISINDGIPDAFQNGLRVKYAIIRWIPPLNDNMAYYSSITKLIIRGGSLIITRAPFTKSLRYLNISYRCDMNDDALRLCDAIETLDASNNEHITSCAPFAKTLRILHARNTCGINDDALLSCIGIIELDAGGNCKITTCKPFAHTLKILYAEMQFELNTHKYIPEKNCGITDDGLSLCTNIISLYASNNLKITTCAPFGHTLKILHADMCSRITDDGLSSCTAIRELRACGNNKITTCAPFAHTLKILSADTDYYGNICGITDAGLSLCTAIEKLSAVDNSQITTCKPFANTLKALNASKEWCGITDAGLKTCYRIKTLDANHNHKITTCKPFSKSLYELDASYSCGITDAGLEMCYNINDLDASHNPNITACIPFAKSLKHLSACGKTCGISNEGLQLCKSLTSIACDRNTKIDDIYTKICTRDKDATHRY